MFDILLFAFNKLIYFFFHLGALEFINPDLSKGVTKTVRNAAKGVVLDFAYKISSGESVSKIQFFYEDKNVNQRILLAIMDKGKSIVMNNRSINGIPVVPDDVKNNIYITADDLGKAQVKLKEVLNGKHDGTKYICIISLESGTLLEGAIAITVISKFLS